MMKKKGPSANNPTGGFKIARKRSCKVCGKLFLAKFGMNRYCSRKCWGRYKRSRYWKPLEVKFSPAFAGINAELFAAFSFSVEGWHVYPASGGYAPFDLVVFKDGLLRAVEVRKGKMTRNGKKVQFNRGATLTRPLFKVGTHWVAVVIVEERKMFVFPIGTNFYDVSSAIDIRVPNHPMEGINDR